MARLASPAALAIVCVVVFQVLYNRWAAGVWTLSSYGAEPFSLAQGDELRVLFSFNHGLFVWYPVVGLLLVVGLWQRPSRPWALLALGAIELLTIIYGSWNPWNLGGAMGMRGMVDIVPVLALPAGLGLAGLRRSVRFAVLPIAAVLAFVTVELMVGTWTGTLAVSGNTSGQYWQHVVGEHSALVARAPSLDALGL